MFRRLIRWFGRLFRCPYQDIPAEVSTPAWVPVEKVPDSFVHNGRTLVDGVDYHGSFDRELIERYGYNNLNFVPSTPPEYR